MESKNFFSLVGVTDNGGDGGASIVCVNGSGRLAEGRKTSASFVFNPLLSKDSLFASYDPLRAPESAPTDNGLR